MREINDLLDRIHDYCNVDPFYTTFGEVVEYEQPSKYIVRSTNYSEDYDTPVLTAGQTFVLGYTNEKDGIFNASQENPVIIFDDFTGAFKWVDFPFKVKSSAMKILTARADRALLRYVYHMMGKINYSSSEHKRLWISTYSKFDLPLPSLRIQSDIAELLDTFSSLTAELLLELSKRKKQYGFYKKMLLSKVWENTSTKTIGEIAKYRRGSFPQPYGNIEWYDGDGAMPFVQVADIADNLKLVETTKRQISKLAQSKSVFAEKGTVIVSLQGSIGRVAVTQYDAYVDRTIAIFTDISKELNFKFFVYQLQRIFSLKEKTARGSTIKTITKEEFTNFNISYPSLEIQNQIVKILDAFENYVNDFENGLPAEIAARQKQYEYYRDKLLTFERA